MHNQRSLKDQLTLLFGGRAVEKTIAFVSLVVFARLMSPTELALVPTFFIASSAAIMLAALGAMPVIMVELPRAIVVDRPSGAAMIRTVLRGYVGGLLAWLAGLAIYPGTDWISDKTGLSELTLWLLAAGACVQGGFTLLVQIQSALSRFGVVVRANNLVTALRLIFVVIGHQLLGATGVMLGLLGSSAVGSGYAGWKIRDQLRQPTTQWGFRKFLGLSWPLYFEGFLMFLRRQGDQVIVGSMLGAEALTGYYLARRFSHLLKTVADTVNVGLAPRLSRLSLRPDQEFAVHWRRYLSLAMSLAVPIALLSAIIAPAHIAIVGGTTYVSFALPASILCLGAVADMVNGPIINRAAFVLYSPRFRVLLTVAETAILLPLLALGATQLGATGAALAVVVAGTLAGLLGLLILRRRLETGRFLEDVPKWFGPSLLAAAVGLAVSALVRHLPLPIFELREVVAAVAGAATFGLTYVNMLSRDGMELLESTLDATRLKFAIRYIRLVRLRR